MRSRPLYLVYLWLILVSTSLACSMTSNLATNPEPRPTRPRYVVLPPVTPTAVPGLADLSLPEAATPPSLAAAPSPTRRPRPTTTPTPDNFARLFTDMLRMFSEATATPTDAPRLVQLPTLAPTPTSTATFIPTPLPLPTETPTLALVMPTPLPPPTLPPAEAPIVEAPPPAPEVVESAFISPVNPPAPAPVSAPAPVPAPPVADSTFSSPVNPPAQSPAAAAAAPAPIDSGYDFMLAEFFNSPTTNAILVIYVAIVDPNEIPIGDIKVVGTRLDHNLTYDSPLSTWHFEGYNAPGEVIKSGNVKFEPPSGMETTNWVLHLEDPSGRRLSEDVPFNTDVNNKQWYFIKFKRKF